MLTSICHRKFTHPHSPLRGTIALLLAVLLLGAVPLEAFAVVNSTEKMPIQVAGGDNHTVILYSDGTVAAIGKNSDGQCNVDSWRNIVQIDAGYNHTVGIRSDGSVVATGRNRDGQCNVGSWRNIVQVAAGEAHTLGLRQDGTVVAVGSNASHQCEVGRWRGITQIAAAKVNSLGLTADNQVIIRGAFTTADDFHLGGWTDVVSIASGTGYFAGVKANCTVVGYGHNTDPEGRGNYSDISVDGWRNIIQMAVGRCNAFGLTWDGYVLCSGRNDFGQMDAVRCWRDVKYIAAGNNHVIGIQWDGSLIAAGDNSYNQCNVAPLGAGTGTDYQRSAVTVSAGKNSVTMKRGGTKYVMLTLSGILPQGFTLWAEWSGAVSAEWVDWGVNSGKKGPIMIHGDRTGTGQVTIKLTDGAGNCIDTATITVNVVS